MNQDEFPYFGYQNISIHMRTKKWMTKRNVYAFDFNMYEQ